jgi:molybdenum cofactor cytidylyltransferase
MHGPSTVSLGAVEAALTPETPTPPVAGVVLAAGRGSRFGSGNKLLAEVDGEPVVRRAARTLVEADLPSVTVVVGHEATAVQAAVDGLGVDVAHNPAYPDGQSTSVREGVERASGTAAALFLPGDMPFVDGATVGSIVDAYRADLGDAVAPVYGGRRGNPVLFDRTHFEALRAVQGDVGGRSVFLDADRSVCLSVPDPGVRVDIDTRADLAAHG